MCVSKRGTGKEKCISELGTGKEKCISKVGTGTENWFQILGPEKKMVLKYWDRKRKWFSNIGTGNCNYIGFQHSIVNVYNRITSSDNY